MNMINGYRHAIYCNPENFLDHVFNLISNYSNFSNHYYKIIKSSTDLEADGYLVIKEVADQSTLYQLLKIFSYCSIALPIIMFVGKIIQSYYYTFIDVSPKFLTNLQRKLIDSQDETFRISQLSFDDLDKFYDKLSIYQIEEWLTCFKIENGEAKLCETLSKLNIEQGRFTQLCDRFFERALNEWENDPSIKGEKQIASDRARACRKDQTPVLCFNDLDLTSFPPIFPLVDHIITLDCSNNSVNVLNESIGCLHKLKHAFFRSNKIEIIPSSFGNLISLCLLNLDHNPLKNIDSICNLNLLHLDLNGCGFKKLPSALKRLTNLLFLGIGKNQFSDSNDALEPLQYFKMLYQLNLSGCDLKDLPEYFGKFQHLKELNLSMNQQLLMELPPQICELPSLKSLNLSLCGLTKLHSSISNLNRLEELNLSGNQLLDFPIELIHFNKLKKLEMSSCGLEELSSLIFMLRDLKELNLSSNKLSSLPTEIKKLSKLEVIFLANNEFTTFPLEIVSLPMLTCLDICKNELSELPPQISKLTHLKVLDCSYNPRLREFPLDLDNISQLTFLKVSNTGITPEVQEAIFESSKILKSMNILDLLPAILKRWFIIGKSTLEPANFDDLDPEVKHTLKEWLARLEKSIEFKGRQAELAALVCQILTYVLQDEDFKQFFFDQVRVNNDNWGDRAAVSLEVIFLTWTIKIHLKKASFKEQLSIMKKVAKSITLMRLVAVKINEYQLKHQTTVKEPAEIYFYYLIEAKKSKSVELLSCFEGMPHSDIGERGWINTKQLFDEVNKSYFEDFNKLSVFYQLLNNQKFKVEFKSWVDGLNKIADEFGQKSTEHEKLKPKDLKEDSPNYKKWESESSRIAIERSDAQVKFLKDVLEKID